jgi:hypothetical protein
MSIRDEIRARVAEGRLAYLPPLISSLPAVRAMFVSEEINGVVRPPWTNTAEGLRFSELRAHLDMFTVGTLISIANDPFRKPKATYMARVDPSSDEVWDIRSIDPSPAIRVLGCFGETDTFVALVWDYRINLSGPRSKEWRDFREACKAEWRKLFGPYPPFSGGDAYDYISRNIYVV